ncbi:MAG: 2-oxoglutarate dehydrogenase E1 component [Anaerolineae bacterium]|nr:2-oxoglutarate dehydrogenase E1 component [Gemmatimonadaceae bacterium]
MSDLPVSGVFNDGYIAEVYERFQRDASSVDPSFRQLFALAAQLARKTDGAAALDPEYLRKVAGAAALADAIRHYGHMAVRIDPLGSQPPGAAELTPEHHGLTQSDLERIPGTALGFPNAATANEVVLWLRSIYSSTMGFEFEHIGEDPERDWFRGMIEGDDFKRTQSPQERIAVLRRLTQVDGLERFIGRAYLGYKRFSIEGTDALVPMIDEAIEQCAAAGATQVVLGMAHRGRINVLAHILDKPYAAIFQEFEGKHSDSDSASDTGDVKYHLGWRTEKTLRDGKTVGILLLPNPSHLEFVNPVVAGVARALQRVRETDTGTIARDGSRNEDSVLPIVVHGDAAFPAEGVVAETFNMSALRGYRVGGTLHIILNNQVGFTTDPIDGRSTHYASDLAKGFDVPIVHVNGDDPDGCIAAVRLGLAYRARFKRDFLIDLVGYRRYGHNETDEPAYTQPMMYETIRKHRTTRLVWGARLASEGVIDEAEIQRVDDEIQRSLEKVHGDIGAASDTAAEADEADAREGPQVETVVKAESLIALNERMLTFPSDFKPVPKLAKQLERRRVALGESGGVDWGHAEALAWASLLSEGISVRITGQDTERGTFSHRQAVLHHQFNSTTYTPLANLTGAKGAFEIYNSPLSEAAVMGFDYGFSVAAPDALTLWEAQFGDFVNVAQPIIDQFLAADRAKWRQNSGLVLLLPHGYEGQGPEHSSAKLERFLQLSAEGNLRVAYPSTPAQYFHILRRQAKNPTRRPLVLMQPKSLLRLPEAASRLADLVSGGFQTVIDDSTAAGRPDAVTRLVFCSGKVYYDLQGASHDGGKDVGQNGGASHVAVIRIEELYPWPHEELSAVIDRYPNAAEAVWVQEEPKNMGAWTFVSLRLPAALGNAFSVRYIGRPGRASPAEGHLARHQEQQAKIIADALAPVEVTARAKRRGVGVGK